MFKRLRERIAEETTKFPIGQLNNSNKQSSDAEGRPSEGVEDLITLSDSSAVVVPYSSSQQFSIGDEDGAASEQNTPQKKSSDASNGSANDHPASRGTPQGSGSDFGYAKEYRPTKSAYIPQSDIESEREDPPTLNLEGISKDQLLTIIDLLKARSYKYKNKYSEVVKNYKELRDEKLKIENTLIEHQDKGLRRMAELREQCQLEQKAKAHLEANLRLLMEEKDSRISVLETQINLLKESGNTDSVKNFPDVCDSQNSDSSGGDLQFDNRSCSVPNHSVLQEKLERLEHQIHQAKRTITSQTDQLSLLRKQNENLSQELETKVKKLNEIEDSEKKQLTLLKEMQVRLQELQEQQEESVMSMAETKKNMHEELESREKLLAKVKEEAKQLQAAYDSEKAKVSELQTQQDDKVNALKRQLDTTEKMLEEERESLMHELGRGKSAALSLMQQECAKRISAVEEEWKVKLQELQNEKDSSGHIKSEVTETKFIDMEGKLKALEDHAEKLEATITQLENENAVLKSSLENLEDDVAFTSEKLEKLQVEYLDLQEINKIESSRFEEKLEQEIRNRLQVYEQAESEHHKLREFLKEQLNEKQNVIDDMVHNKNALYNQIEGLEKREKQLKIKFQEFENKEKELTSTIDQNFTQEKELYSRINELENKEKELHSKYDLLVNEGNIRNSELINLKASFEAVSKNDKLKDQELKLQDEVKQLNLDREILIKKLEEEIVKVKAENKDLESKINLYHEDFRNLENKLLGKEDEVTVLNDKLTKSSSEISDLSKSLVEKTTSFDKVKQQCSEIGVVLDSLEKDFNVNSALSKQDQLCKTIFEKISVLSQQFVALQEKSITDSIDPVPVGTDLECTGLYCTSNAFSLNSDEQSIHEHVDINKDAEFCTYSNISLQECTGCLDVKQLRKAVCDFENENKKLKQELKELKEFTENQSVEFAKNITELHESLNQLQDERNNLSLVLQSLETQTHEMNHDSLKAINSELSDSKSEISRKDENECKLDIMQLNQKVKTEITALSTQTEMISYELKCLREQFRYSQLTYSDKVAQLNTKLVLKTELLLSVKNELDESIHNFEEFKCLAEAMKDQLDEKEEHLKILEKDKQDLENKCKELKEKYGKKELSLKQLHLTQLNDLKNQTKATIDKLNDDILKASAVAKGNEEDLNLKLLNAKEQYENELQRLGKPEKWGNVVDNILEVYKNFDAQLLNSLNKWDMHNSRIVDLNSKLNHISNKWKENTKICEMQRIKIDDLMKEVGALNEDGKSSKNLKIKLEEVSSALEKANCALESERESRKHCENNNLELQQRRTLAEEVISDLGAENEKLSCSLKESISELEEIKDKYSEVCSSLEKAVKDLKVLEAEQSDFEKLKSSHDLLLEELSSVRDSATKENKTAVEALKCVSEWNTVYNSILSNFKGFACKSYENLEKLNCNLDVYEPKLRLLESQVLRVAKLSKLRKNESSQFENEIKDLKQTNEGLLEEWNLVKQSKVEELEQKLIAFNKSQSQLEDALLILKTSEAENELLREKTSTLENELAENCIKLKGCEKKLEVEQEKLLKSEEIFLNLNEKYKKMLDSLQEASELCHKKESELLSLSRKLEEQNVQLSSMIRKEDLDECKKWSTNEISKISAEVNNLNVTVDELRADVLKKETEIKAFESEKTRIVKSHSESIKSMKDKLLDAEKNYDTQLEEMRNQILQLEADKPAVETLKNELSNLKNLENTLKTKLQSKEDEWSNQQEKYESLSREHTARIHSLQDAMKDKENMVLKLNTNIESLTREYLEKSEELKHRIKVLEEEREQLMIHAQERVSKTEAKCREDVKFLQDKNNELLVEIEKLNAKITGLDEQLSERCKFVESAAEKDTLELKEQLAVAEGKLTEAEMLKQASERELSAKLQKLQDENATLLGKANHIEKLKSEKEELNEKVKQAEKQITSINLLESERDALRNENTSILTELERLRQSDPELQTKFNSLKESENKLIIELEELKTSKENFESELSKLKSSFELEVRTLKSENENLSKQVGLLEKLQFSDRESDSVKEYISVIRGECETALKAKDEELENKLKLLVRDFCIQMDVKDKDCDKMVSELLDKNQDLEDKLLREHRKESSELRQALFEKECALDDVREHYEDALQKKDKKLKELQASLKKLSEHSHTKMASHDVDLLTEEPSDWDDTWAVPDECVENTSPVHNAEACKEHSHEIESLQEELTKCNSEIKELKILLRLSPPESTAINIQMSSDQSLPEPTEIEYLKNIIFEYMMGKEPITLAKVIAAVLRFSDSQTQQVIHREEARHPTISHWLSQN